MQRPGSESMSGSQDPPGECLLHILLLDWLPSLGLALTPHDVTSKSRQAGCWAPTALVLSLKGLGPNLGFMAEFLGPGVEFSGGGNRRCGRIFPVSR